MIHTCRIVLNNLRTLSKSSTGALNFLENTTCICLFDDYNKTYDYNRYKGEIHSIIDQLVSDGYLSLDPRNGTFSLTQRGLHPYQFQWDAFKSFLFTSILVPVGVSLATTLLTLFIQSLF